MMNYKKAKQMAVPSQNVEIDPRSKTTYNNAVNYIATGKPELEVQGQGAVLQEKKRSSKAY